MQGFPHSYEPEESMSVELWIGVTQSGRGPVIWIPMKRNPKGDEVKGEGLISNYIKPNENRTPSGVWYWKHMGYLNTYVWYTFNI